MLDFKDDLKSTWEISIDKQLLRISKDDRIITMEANETRNRNRNSIWYYECENDTNKSQIE